MEVKLCSVSQVPLWMCFYILITKKHFISFFKRENLHRLLNSSHRGLKCSKSMNKQSPNRKMAKSSNESYELNYSRLDCIFKYELCILTKHC